MAPDRGRTGERVSGLESRDRFATANSVKRATSTVHCRTLVQRLREAPSASTAGASSERRAPSAYLDGSLALGAVRPQGNRAAREGLLPQGPPFISKSDARCPPPEWPETVAEPADVGPRRKAGLPDAPPRPPRRTTKARGPGESEAG
ncbi:hypothetical protein IscW_ISCW023214 [Ixodes scapularis]|uniref:Uncharacterized protein n=1 Tax=Ixodes scapularis TaxID=6945 RepID=B7QJ97_IXOSC|nr:hypothetical protein IscW_ISCW023214 [Ixodes scapularis]|eukprot:XP_002415254.1 hypothetical protein IscW_ISCW023214 [Ixodes scapularis]